jgi:methylmalonyl-CoA mutase N-terminal domain/subunit
MTLRFHAQTAGSTLTAQQPENNVVRVALQAMAAVLGGCQSLHTNAKDEALALPTAESARLALRTQQIIAHETGVTDTVDPMGGSYALERLTDELEAEAQALIERIDQMGGMVEAISKGWVQREVQEAAFTYQREIETKQRVVVGVNDFTTEEPAPTGLHHVDPAVEKRQAERLQQLRRRRSQQAVTRCLSALRQGARGSENLLPLILDSVKSLCTLGEISDILREEFGEYREQVVL